MRSQRREYLRSFFHGKIPYLFIESICSDMDVLEQNYRYKMLYSPDYAGITMEKGDLSLQDALLPGLCGHRARGQ